MGGHVGCAVLLSLSVAAVLCGSEEGRHIVSAVVCTGVSGQLVTLRLAQGHLRRLLQVFWAESCPHPPPPPRQFGGLGPNPQNVPFLEIGTLKKVIKLK